MKASDLRDVFEAGRPLVRQWLDIATQMAAIRDACREKEIDWSQVKALLKAEMQDAEDGTDKRVRAILERADNATAYADMLGLSEKNISRETPFETQQPPKATDTPAGAIDAPLAVQVAPAEISAPAPAEIPDMPDFLRRSA